MGLEGHPCVFKTRRMGFHSHWCMNTNLSLLSFFLFYVEMVMKGLITTVTKGCGFNKIESYINSMVQFKERLETTQYTIF